MRPGRWPGVLLFDFDFCTSLRTGLQCVKRSPRASLSSCIRSRKAPRQRASTSHDSLMRFSASLNSCMRCGSVWLREHQGEHGTRRTVVMLMLVGVWGEARTKILSVGLQRFLMGCRFQISVSDFNIFNLPNDLKI